MSRGGGTRIDDRSSSPRNLGRGKTLAPLRIWRKKGKMKNYPTRKGIKKTMKRKKEDPFLSRKKVNSVKRGT